MEVSQYSRALHCANRSLLLVDRCGAKNMWLDNPLNIAHVGVAGSKLFQIKSRKSYDQLASTLSFFWQCIMIWLGIFFISLHLYEESFRLRTLYFRKEGQADLKSCSVGKNPYIWVVSSRVQTWAFGEFILCFSSWPLWHSVLSMVKQQKLLL